MTGEPVNGPSAAAPPDAGSARPGRRRPKRSRRRRLLRRALIAGGLLVAVVIALVVAVFVANRDQRVQLPADGSPLPTVVVPPPPGSLVSYRDVGVQQGPNQRRAAILVPADLAPGERLPLVVLLHGASSSPSLFVQQGAWEQAVATYRFVALVPRGVSDTWNAGRCCRPAITLGIDDVALLDALISDTARRPEVDPGRVFMAGESNGGMMVYRYLCDYADRIAGAASVAGTNVSGCQPSRPTPVLQIHGDADRVVPFGGGRSPLGVLRGSGAFAPVRTAMSEIADAYGCSAPADQTLAPTVVATDWSGCDGGARVRLVRLAGWDHVWPRPPTFDATTEILRFFGLVR